MSSAVVCLGLLVVPALIFYQFSLHEVTEGHVGVYYRGGALLKRVTTPGYHFKLPFVDRVENVQITLQTDKVTDIPCGTSGGVLIWISHVEVVNRLRQSLVYDTIKNYTVNYDKIWIFDKIHHEINQFCSAHTLHEVYIDLFHTVDEMLVNALQRDCNKYAPGIEIIAIRITKPKIPHAIARNYELMEAEKTKLLIATEAQKVLEKEAETDRRVSTIEAEKVAGVSKIRMEQQIAEKAARQKMAKIEDETYLHKEQTRADAEFYFDSKRAEANKKILTAEYLMLEAVRALSNNTKLYFGKSVGQMYHDFF